MVRHVIATNRPKNLFELNKFFFAIKFAAQHASPITHEKCGNVRTENVCEYIEHYFVLGCLHLRVFGYSLLSGAVVKRLNSLIGCF